MTLFKRGLSQAELMARIPWYAALSPADRKQHDLSVQTITVGRGGTVVSEGATAQAVFAVADGVAMVSKSTPSGAVRILGFLFPGDVIGLAHALVFTHGVRALTPMTLVEIPRPCFEAILARSSDMQRAVFREASHELAAAQDHLVLLGRKTAAERLATFLLAMKDRSPLGDGTGNLWLPMRRSDIANYLGLTLETLSRQVHDFAQRGLIERQHVRALRICDAAGLARLASGDQGVAA